MELNNEWEEDDNENMDMRELINASVWRDIVVSCVTEIIQPLGVKCTIILFQYIALLNRYIINEAIIVMFVSRTYKLWTGM